MKILMVNKFLYPNGGSETYIFKLGEELTRKGHEVQYFGMEHEGRIVGNHAECYTDNMDFHTGKLQKLLYPFKIIYSKEAYRKMLVVLKDFNPDVVHLNNFNFQLTPSIIYAVRKYEKKSHRKIRLVYTAHDSQLVCPNHLMLNAATGKGCDLCIHGHYGSCTKYRCIHGSLVKSMLGTLEASIYKNRKIYAEIDTIISPSHFLAEKLSANAALKGRILVMHNFVDIENQGETTGKKDYVIYFGRYSGEKGTETLTRVCRELPDIPFLFAGSGPLENLVDEVPNITNKGFLSHAELQKYIAEARFSLITSECYENCPFSVMESQIDGTPVLGADIGGIPELLTEGVTGELFTPGDAEELKQKISELWNHPEKTDKYSQNCARVSFDNVSEYCDRLIMIYVK